MTPRPSCAPKETKSDLRLVFTSLILGKASDQFLRRTPAKPTKRDIAADVVDWRLDQDVLSTEVTTAKSFWNGSVLLHYNDLVHYQYNFFT